MPVPGTPMVGTVLPDEPEPPDEEPEPEVPPEVEPLPEVEPVLELSVVVSGMMTETWLSV